MHQIKHRDELYAQTDLPLGSWFANSENIASNQEITRLELLTAVELTDFSQYI